MGIKHTPYLIKGILGGLIGVITVITFGISLKSLLVFPVLIVLLIIALIDINTKIIPDCLVILLGMLALLFLLFQEPPALKSRILGAVSISLFLLFITILTRGSFGGGDIKLIFAAGFLLGLKGAVLAGVLAIISGGIFSAGMILSKRGGRKSLLAFGPFLAFGTAVSLLWEEKFIYLYQCMLN